MYKDDRCFVLIECKCPCVLESMWDVQYDL